MIPPESSASGAGGAPPATAPESGEAPVPPPDKPSCVVGLGASAGGLETFERFFKNTPPDSGMAFVLVQHLDPTAKSLLMELVQRYTPMPVAEVEDGMALSPDHVYIIPPNHDLAIRGGRLRLQAPEMRRGLRLPIDFFLRSLASDCRERAIAVVLSGTGTDGTQGIRAVKGEGGLTVAQRPATAAYEGMPASAIASGAVDLVLAPEEMPAQLADYARNRPPPVTGAAADAVDPGFERVLQLVCERTGHDFSQYKPATLRRRLERRLVITRLPDMDAYLERLERDPEELETLFREFLIRVTSFFRDREAFQLIEQRVIPELCGDHPAGRPLRLWVPGCATGEEAYSLALLLLRYLERQGRDLPVQIFATDIDADAVERARAGVYPEGIAADVPAELLGRYFEHRGTSWQVKKRVREMIVFAVQSVTKDPPFSNLDLISCRNLLIYLRPELQRRVLSLFHYVLANRGWLVLGPSESVAPLEKVFETVDKHWRLYRTRGQLEAGTLSGGPSRPMIPAQAAGGHGPPSGGADATGLKQLVRRLTEQTLLDHFDAACITIDPEGEIVYVHGSTRPFLDHIQGEPSLDLLRLARKGLRPVLASAIAGARRSGEPIRHERVRVSQENGDRLCNVTLHAVLQPAALKGYLTVLLEDAGPVPEPAAAEAAGATGEYVATLERELRDTRGYLQATVEQLESTNEELTSANEELQSANEELQSTNEELQTSQEELRSVNEELLTVNTELETKVEALDQAHNDLSNLMASTELAILFLDTELRVQRFTAATTRLLHLAEADIGRPIDHIAGELDYPHLARDAQALLDTLQSTEKEIRDRDGRWYLLRLRPYRTTGNVIRGVVLAFVDIHAQKRGEELKRLTEALEQSPVTVMITNREAEIQYVNPSFTEVTGYGADEVLGQNPRLLKSGEHPPDFYRELWDTISAGRVWRGRFCDRKKNGELFWESASISPVRDEAGRISHYVAVKEDITGRMHMEMVLRASEARYREVVDNLNAGVVVYEATQDGENFLIRDMNSASERLSRLERSAVMDRPVTEVFPGVAELGLLAVLQRVWRSGVPEHLPAARYADPRLTQWVENYVYRLPTGEVVAIYEDVTARRAEVERRATAEAALRRANSILAVLGAWYRGMAQDGGGDGVARAGALCRLLVEQGGYLLAWVGVAADGDERAVHPVARAGEAGDYVDSGTFTWGDDPHGQGPTGRAIRSGRPVRMGAMDTDPTFTPWREAALARGFKSSIALPLRINKEVFGALNIYSAEVEAFSEEETALLEELAASLAAAMRGHLAPEDETT